MITLTFSRSDTEHLCQSISVCDHTTGWFRRGQNSYRQMLLPGRVQFDDAVCFGRRHIGFVDFNRCFFKSFGCVPSVRFRF